MAVETDIHLGVVSSEAEANRLIGSYEPLVIHAEPMRLAQLLEDELILSMSMTPKHPAGTCKAFSDEPEAPPQRHANPFAVLAKLRTKDS